MAAMKTVAVKLKDKSDKYFRFSGVGSSESRDAHGDIIKQRGINLSLVKQGKAIVTAEHETTIGKIEFAEIRGGKLYVEGVVYVTTIKAKQFYDRLIKNDPNKPITLSIEFVNPEYNKNDVSVLNEVILTGIALVGIKAEPANKDTYAELLKSVSKADLFNRASSSRQ